MGEPRGSVEAIKKIVELGGKIGIDEMAQIGEMAEMSGGRLVWADGEDDWCGTGRIIIKWPPPEPKPFISLLDFLAQNWINWEVLINGQPVPDYLVMDVRRWTRHH